MIDNKLKHKISKNNRSHKGASLSFSEFFELTQNLYTQKQNQLIINSQTQLNIPEKIVFCNNKGEIKILQTHFNDRVVTYPQRDAFLINYFGERSISGATFTQESSGSKVFELDYSSFDILIISYNQASDDTKIKERYQKVTLANNQNIYVELFFVNKRITTVQFSSQIEKFIETHIEKDPKQFYNNCSPKEKHLFLMNFNIPDKSQRFFFNT